MKLSGLFTSVGKAAVIASGLLATPAHANDTPKNVEGALATPAGDLKAPALKDRAILPIAVQKSDELAPRTVLHLRNPAALLIFNTL